MPKPWLHIAHEYISTTSRSLSVSSSFISCDFYASLKGLRIGVDWPEAPWLLYKPPDCCRTWSTPQIRIWQQTTDGWLHLYILCQFFSYFANFNVLFKFKTMKPSYKFVQFTSKKIFLLKDISVMSLAQTRRMFKFRLGYVLSEKICKKKEQSLLSLAKLSWNLVPPQKNFNWFSQWLDSNLLKKRSNFKGR